MIWPTPLLNGPDLFAWFAPSSGTAILPEGYHTMYWRAGGAEALAEVCDRIAIQKNRRISLLLPGYFCGQSLRFLRSSNVELLFYPLTDDLVPDYSYIEETCINKNFDIFLHVHYFGKIEGHRESREFTNKYGAVLIEDCAHIISPWICDEWEGDYLIFSPHKHFPLPRLGVVLSKELNDINHLHDSDSSALPHIWAIKQFVRRVWRIGAGAEWGVTWTDQNEDLVVRRQRKGLIKMALSAYQNSDNVASIRRENSTGLSKILAPIEGWNPLIIDGSITSPYVIGMLCGSRDISRHRFKRLNHNYSLVMQWPDLPIEIRTNEDISGWCLDRVERTLFFFVHQRLDTGQWLEVINDIVHAYDF